MRPLMYFIEFLLQFCSATPLFCPCNCLPVGHGVGEWGVIGDCSSKESGRCKWQEVVANALQNSPQLRWLLLRQPLYHLCNLGTMEGVCICAPQSPQRALRSAGKKKLCRPSACLQAAGLRFFFESGDCHPYIIIFLARVQYPRNLWNSAIYSRRGIVLFLSEGIS